MKIASFNINNINSRLTNLTNWLREADVGSHLGLRFWFEYFNVLSGVVLIENFHLS